MIAGIHQPAIQEFPVLSLALSTGSGIVGLIIFILDIVAIVSVVQSSMDTGKKVLWILLILFLPVIGMVLYFLLGR